MFFQLRAWRFTLFISSVCCRNAFKSSHWFSTVHHVAAATAMNKRCDFYATCLDRMLTKCFSSDFLCQENSSPWATSCSRWRFARKVLQYIVATGCLEDKKFMQCYLNQEATFTFSNRVVIQNSRGIFRCIPKCFTICVFFNFSYVFHFSLKIP